MSVLFSSEFNQRIYIFSINIGSFVNDLNLFLSKNDEALLLVKNCKEIVASMENITNMSNKEKILSKLEACKSLLNYCYSVLINIKLTDKFLQNEKSDLIIELSDFLKNFTNIIFEYKKNHIT